MLLFCITSVQSFHPVGRLDMCPAHRPSATSVIAIIASPSGAENLAILSSIHALSMADSEFGQLCPDRKM